MNSTAPVFLLVGFLVIYLSNRLLNLYICHKYECMDYAVGIIPMLGIGFHSKAPSVLCNLHSLSPRPPDHRVVG